MPVHRDRRPHQAPLQHPPEAQAAEDRARSGLRLGRAAHRHAVGQGLLRRRSASSTRRGRRCRAASRTSSRCRGPNGYQSLHTSVVSERGLPFEVQIRTADMHRTAEEGIAAHWKYKEGRVGAGSDEQYFLWLRQLLEWQQEVRDPQEFLQNLKIELYPEEVYIFTPKGEVKALPRDATPVDFAYSIHTDVGHQCVGARVNGKMVPLRARLRNGDIVEIVTTAGAQAEPRLAELRRHLARAQQDQALHPRGREGAQPRARAQAVRQGGPAVRPQPEEPDRAPDDGAACSASTGWARRTSSSRRSATASSRRRPCWRSFVPQEELKEAPESGIASVVRRVLGTGEDKIKVRGIDDLMVFRARCCNPIRGEKIVGYITRGQGRVGPLRQLLERRSTCSTTRSGGSTSSGTREPTARPTPSG